MRHLLLFETFIKKYGEKLFALIMRWTGSYWVTDAIFYLLSASFFGLYFYFSRKEKRRVELQELSEKEITL